MQDSCTLAAAITEESRCRRRQLPRHPLVSRAPAAADCVTNIAWRHSFPPSQTWCRGKKLWESEALCMDCHSFSWRSYKDPDFLFPHEMEKLRFPILRKTNGDASNVAASSAVAAATTVS